MRKYRGEKGEEGRVERGGLLEDREEGRKKERREGRLRGRVERRERGREQRREWMFGGEVTEGKGG